MQELNRCDWCFSVQVCCWSVTRKGNSSVCTSRRCTGSILKGSTHCSWCLISDPSWVQEPGGRGQLETFLRSVPHATEGTSGNILRGLIVSTTVSLANGVSFLRYQFLLWKSHWKNLQFKKINDVTKPLLFFTGYHNGRL